MNKNPPVLGITLIGALALLTTSASAQIITQPAGLTPGEQYRLVFVTDGTIAATDSNFADYNTFVTNQADAASALQALSTTWAVIGSTATVTASINTGTNPGTGVPIYGLNGSLVAATYTQLWGGTLSSGISVTESDNSDGTIDVWTGTAFGGGFASNGDDLGHSPAISAFADTVGANWIDAQPVAATDLMPVYAISGVLTAAPEPGSAALLALGAGALVGWRRRRNA